MRWKVKSKIQNAISVLPSKLSYSIYYWVQRKFGGLRPQSYCPVSKLSAAVEIWRCIKNQGHNPEGKVFFEVGTGRDPIVPLAFWLMGAKKTITIDSNPYLKYELVHESIRYIANNKSEIVGVFNDLLCTKRLEKLLKLWRSSDFSLAAYMNTCGIEYLAPGDASCTGLPEGCIDYYTSYTVFEHIHPDKLLSILTEGSRITKSEGLFINYIDYSDHFSHSDNRISVINFLQYTDAEWDRFAGNRYMYMNRLRHDDFIVMFESLNHVFLDVRVTVDSRVQGMLKNNEIHIDDKFKSKSEDILSISGAMLVSKYIPRIKM